MSNPLLSLRARRAGTVLLAGAALAAAPASAHAAAVGLGTAAPFVVLGGSTVTNTGPSVLNGDLGVAPGSALDGFGLPAVVNGAVHDNDAVAAKAQVDLTAAYDVAAAQPVTSELTGQDLGGKTLTAGAYKFSTSAQLTGALTLNAQGDPAAHFVIKVGSTLTTASASSVRLINGASPCNVFWQVGSSATLGSTTAFQGNVLAYTSISLNNGTTVQGRMLARNGAVTLDDNVLNAPRCGTSTSSTTGGDPEGDPGAAGGAVGTGKKPAGSKRKRTKKGTAVLRSRSPRTPGSRRAGCVKGFRASVHGKLIKRVVFSISGRRVATRTGPRFRMYVRPDVGRRGVLKARVTFEDATRARTLRFRYRACTAAVLRPVQGPSQFTG